MGQILGRDGWAAVANEVANGMAAIGLTGGVPWRELAWAFERLHWRKCCSRLAAYGVAHARLLAGCSVRLQSEAVHGGLQRALN